MTGTQEDVSASKLDEGLMKLLVCPLSKAPIVQLGSWLYSTDRATRRRYPIRDGIPIMLIDESEVIEEDQHEQIMADAGIAK